MRHILLYAAIVMNVLFAACRHDEYIIYSEDQDTGQTAVSSEITGMYLLNEGNMGSNKCTLDFLDLSGNTPTVHYTRNIYSERNPSEVKELGDVGNDIAIHGDQLWMVINASNKVEVATVSQCRKIAKIDIPNCRYVTFYGDDAYVTSYVGPVMVSSDAPLGRVYKVSTHTFEKKDSMTVGYQPEQLCTVGKKMYVANSGGYRVPLYDTTVSEIDLTTFQEVRKIEVGPNLHRCLADTYGQVWVSSRGDYYSTPSRLYWLEQDGSGQMQKGGYIDMPVSDMCITGDSLYFYSAEWNYITMSNQVSYGIVNVRTHQVVTTRLTNAPELGDIEMPYGIIVNPIDRDFYIMDAKNYVSSGELFHFLADGTFDWRVWTGDIPAHAAFVFKEKDTE